MKNMPTKQGLTLLVRMYALRSGIIVATNGTARLAETKERLDYDLVHALAQLDYLSTTSPNAYILSVKGIALASHPAVRVDLGSCWSPGNIHGKRIHHWREYAVGDWREYESACGISRLVVEIVALRPAMVECEACRKAV
jgi:hypothetical protein